jgi:hypothetical protein
MSRHWFLIAENRKSPFHKGLFQQKRRIPKDPTTGFFICGKKPLSEARQHF